MRDYLGLIRWKNLLIIGFTQLFFIYFTRVEFLEFTNFALVLSTLLTAAAGYIINDFYDIEADKVNKPSKIYIGKSIPKDHSRRLYFMLVILSLWIGYYALAQLTSIILTINIALFLYSYRLKRYPIIGNILVSLCSASVIYMVYIASPNSLESFKSNSFPLLFFFSICAFLISLVREIIKDIEDIDGDKKAGYKTLPIVADLKVSKWFAYFSLFALILYYGYYVSITPSTLQLVGLGIISISSIFLMVKIGLANKKEDYSKISKYCKLLMLVGMLTAVFFVV